MFQTASPFTESISSCGQSSCDKMALSLSVSDFFKNFSFFLCLSSLQSLQTFLFLHYILSSLVLCLSISIIFTISADHGLAPPDVSPSLLLSTFVFPFSKGKWTLGNRICLSYIESTGPGNVLASEMAMTKSLIRLTTITSDSENFIHLQPVTYQRFVLFLGVSSRR